MKNKTLEIGRLKEAGKQLKAVRTATADPTAGHSLRANKQTNKQTAAGEAQLRAIAFRLTLFGGLVQVERTRRSELVLNSSAQCLKLSLKGLPWDLPRAPRVLTPAEVARSHCVATLRELSSQRRCAQASS